jgi:hypothetical protein
VNCWHRWVQLNRFDGQRWWKIVDSAIAYDVNISQLFLVNRSTILTYRKWWFNIYIHTYIRIMFICIYIYIHTYYVYMHIYIYIYTYIWRICKENCGAYRNRRFYTRWWPSERVGAPPCCLLPFGMICKFACWVV